MGDELTEVVHALDVAVQGVDKQGWDGEARDAFERHWAEQKRVIDEVAHNFHQVADGLRACADEIDKINEEIIDICVEIAEMEIAGAALSFFTGFLSDLVANTAVATRVARIVDLVKLFTSAAEKVAALLAVRQAQRGRGGEAGEGGRVRREVPQERCRELRHEFRGGLGQHDAQPGR
ncbi:WXG100 family type VII secretion target [Streptomyces sp. NPDC093261]|uniref:WXG100 family type VII secretion target n=1 Tax=Streptomyces sp. NPDC093261 TaxID=3366037 RepID=UPI0038105F6C